MTSAAPPAHPAILLLTLTLWVSGCDGDTSLSDCGLQSTVSDYAPDCATAGLALYPDETRLAVGGVGGYLVVSLPADATAGEVYGGRTGEPLLALLTLSDGRELLSDERGSTVRVASAGAGSWTLGLALEFAAGGVDGAVTAPVRQ